MIGALIKVEQNFHSEHSLAQMHLKLARALIQVGKPDEAIPETRVALDVDKNAFMSLYIRAQAYEAADDTVNAQKTRDGVITAITAGVSKQELRTANKFGDPRVAILLKGDSSDFSALDFSSEVIRLLADRSEPLTAIEKLALAQALIDTGATEQGRTLWESLFMDKSFDTAQAHAVIAAALLKAGDRAHALPHLRRAYELDPLNTTYRMDYDANRAQ